MDALEAIRSRRMIPRVGTERPAREEVEALLEDAVRAPNHHLTEPWRFYVLAGEGLERLAQAVAEAEAEAAGVPVEQAIEGARTKVRRAPVVIVVTCLPSEDPKVVEAEEDAAVAMAIQNLLLSAHARGLGAMLRTGAAAYHPSIRRHLGLADREKVIGFVYLGYPAAGRDPTPRTPAAHKTRWIGWE